MVAILDAFTHGKHLVTVFTTGDRMSKLPERRLFSRIPYYGTLLKAQVEVQGTPTEYGLQHGLQGRRRRRERPGQPAALQGAPGIKPALHLPQRAGPRWRR